MGSIPVSSSAPETKPFVHVLVLAKLMVKIRQAQFDSQLRHCCAVTMGLDQSVLAKISAQSCELLSESAVNRRGSRNKRHAIADCCSLDPPMACLRLKGCPEHFPEIAPAPNFGACSASSREPSQDDPKLFQGSKHVTSSSTTNSASYNSSCEGTAIDEWRRSLELGAVVSLDGEPVILTFDPEAWCFQVRTCDTLYPLAELRGCEELPRAYGSGAADAFELVVSFADLGPLVFQFDEDDTRAAFAGVLHQLALDARLAQPPATTAPSTSSGYIDA